MIIGRPYKKSKLTGSSEQDLDQYRIDLDKDVSNLFWFAANDTASATTGSVFTYTFYSASTDVYWTYNTGSHYLEGWVDGTKRIEL